MTGVTQSPTDTRTKLLAAAEKLVVEQGLTGVSVRKVGDIAGVNPTLVTYHFKTLGKLLDEVCSLNLDPVLAEWQAVDTAKAEGMDAVLRAWLEPMQRAAAFTQGGRALVVLDEIAAHGESALRLKVLRTMEAFSLRLQTAMAPHCSHLENDELRARLRFISGAVLGPPPRSHSALLTGTGLTGAGRPIDDLAYLMDFARAALSN